MENRKNRNGLSLASAPHTDAPFTRGCAMCAYRAHEPRYELGPMEEGGEGVAVAEFGRPQGGPTGQFAFNNEQEALGFIEQQLKRWREGQCWCFRWRACSG